MPSVKIRDNESFEGSLRRFKRAIDKSGNMTSVRQHEAYEKPTTKRKRRRAAAKKRLKKKNFKREEGRQEQTWS